MRVISTILVTLILAGCGEFTVNNAIVNPNTQSNSLWLKLTDETIAPESEFEVVFAPQSRVEIIDAHIQGVDMYMGKIPLFFTLNDNQTYSAIGMVGVCSKPEMQWQIQLRYRDVSSPHEKTATLNFVVTNV